MVNKQTVSIGIPAYNEEQNIKQLLLALLDQQQDSYILQEIIVVSDGSTDGTDLLVRSVADPRIELISVSFNEGLWSAQNKIADAALGDILVLLDADVLPANRTFLQEIIKPLQQHKQVGMVGADTVSASAIGWFESVIAFSHDLKRRIYRRIGAGDTIYLCHGRARAFSRSLYSQLRWPRVYSEDSYSYLFCQQSGLAFNFAPAARVIFRSPMTFSDYAKQSHRFRMGKEQLTHFFLPRLVRQSFHIPIRAFLPVFILAWIRHPILTVSYLFIAASSPFYKKWVYPAGQAEYEIAHSSKAVILP